MTSPFVTVVKNQLQAGGAVTLLPDSDEARAFIALVAEAERMQAAEASVDLRIETERRKVQELMDELARYADPAFWLRVPAYTQAAADKGARARTVLQKYQGA